MTPNKLPPTKLLIARGVVGSRAYGLDTPESDTDTMEVSIADSSWFLGLHSVSTTLMTTVGKNEFDGDRTSYEIGKFTALCVKGNPSVLEFLFLNSYLYEHYYFAKLAMLRTKFLSQRMHKTYSGYAFGQLQRIRNRNDGSFSADLRKRTEKHARHIARLLYQLESAKRTGILRVKLTSSEATDCRVLGQLAVDNLPAFEEQFSAMIERIDAMPSVLPAEPDEESINERLIELRLAHYELTTDHEDKSAWRGVPEEILQKTGRGLPKLDAPPDPSPQP